MKTPGHYTLDSLFAGRPESLMLFRVVQAYVESLGAVRMEVTKTQVSFGTETKFAWVWLPQMWIKARKEDSVTLTFDLPQRVEDPRIRESVEPVPGRWTHHVLIDSDADFDDRVRSWLREAYEASLTKSRAKAERRKRV